MTTQIFTAEDHRALKRAQRALTDLLPLVDKLEQCGPDCAPLREELQRRLQQTELIERLFMQPAPRSR